MFDLFGVPWPHLDLPAVRTFLDDAGEEGVTWEAKADDDDERKRPEGEEPGRLHVRTVQKAGCGLANQIGGYLILGARWDKKAKRWQVPGVVIPGPEPELWVGKALRGLNPVPRFDASKMWKLDDQRVVAVIWIEPVDVPPCMTPLGHVYERVSGETLRVTDPTLLAGLFQRGREARARAEQSADRAARRALEVPTWKHERAVGISIAIASVGRVTDDISSRLFLKSFRDAMSEAIWRFFKARMPVPDISPRPTNMEWLQEQDGLTLIAEFNENASSAAANEDPRRSAWLIQATWDGAVAACATFNPAASRTEELSGFDHVVLPGWREAVPLVERLGGYGPAMLTLAIHATQDEKLPVPRQAMKTPPPPPPPKGTLYSKLREETWARRWVSVGEPASSDVLGSLQREIQRSAGIIVAESEPAPEPDSEAGSS